MGIFEIISLVVSIIGSAASAAYSSAQQKKAAKKERELLEDMAEKNISAAEEEAESIREKGKRLQKSQKAAIAGSGLLIEEEGTPDYLLGETSYLSELDALKVIKEAKDEGAFGRAKGQAAIDRARGYQTGAWLSWAGSTAQSLRNVRLDTAGRQTNREQSFWV